MDVTRLILDALVAGLPYTFNFLGIWLIFRLLDNFDLTVDGSFTLGAALAAHMITHGWNPVVSTVAATAAGAAAGLVTAIIHLRLKVILLLAGIITMIALYSVNLRIMGLPNVSVISFPTIFSGVTHGGPVASDLKVLAVIVAMLVVIAGALGLFLKTEIGLAMRATGANPQMARTVGINTSVAVLIFLVLANALVGFSGAVTAQQEYFADINMGDGVILIGIAAILLGEIFLRRTGSIWFGICGVVLGTCIYNIAVAVAVRAGLNPTDLKAFTSAILLVAIIASLTISNGERWLRLRGPLLSSMARSRLTRTQPESSLEAPSRDVPELPAPDLPVPALAVPALAVPAVAGPAAAGPANLARGSSGVVRGPSGARRQSGLELDNVGVVYNQGQPNETKALRGVSLVLEPGAFLTVIGSNGAGKSTLVSVIAGAVSATTGAVRLGGQDISRVPEHRRARQIARVFQDPLAGTCPEFTIDENLALAAKRGRRRGLAIAVTRARRKRFAEYLAGFGLGLEDRLMERAGRLSGGQRQALSILMAVLQTPDLLLLDEHTAALDPKNQALLLQMTDELVAETGATTVMVTHNMDHAIRYGSEMIMLHRGTVLFRVAGEQKRDLTVPRLVELFHRADDAVFTDEMLFA